MWFGVLGAPAAWTLHLWVGYGYDEFACSASGISDSSVTPVHLVVTTVPVAVSLASLAAAAWSWRKVMGQQWPDPRGRIAFLAFSGLLAGGLFASLVVIGGLGVLTLDPCARG